jgi:CelD/BcsL family acetyltransferase involved in cellulose biosynthesis
MNDVNDAHQRDTPPAKTAVRATELTCRVITDLAGWEQLEPVWDRLLAASPDSTPWQNFSFLTGWWKHLSQGMPLRIYVVERGGTPCLVLPLQISRWKGLPGLPVRMLEPVAMVMDVNRPRFALGELSREAYRCALDEIWKRRQEWDLIRIDEKSWDDAEVHLLRDYATERTWVFRQAFSHLVPYLDLQTAWEDYFQTRSQHMRKNLRAARRKLDKLGPVQLRAYENEQVHEGFQIILDLHTRSWKREHKVEYSKSRGYEAFFAGWVRAMAARGACRVLALFCADKPVAATIAFADADTYYSAQIVHDTAFASCSPGTLLECMELELLMTERRYRKYDFLGSFLNNKMRWTDTATNTAHVLVLQRRLRTFVFDGYYTFVKPYVRPTVVAIYRKLTAKKQNARRAAQS